MKLGTQNDYVIVTSNGTDTWYITSQNIYFGFVANTSTTAATTSAPFKFTNILNNPQSDYDSSTGVYTVSVAGVYDIKASVYVGATSAVLRIYNGNTNIVQGPGVASSSAAVGVTATLYLSAGASIAVRPDQNATATTGSTLGYFMMTRVA